MTYRYLITRSTAYIPDDGLYRYNLTRAWDIPHAYGDRRPVDVLERTVLFIMLNPSTADADIDDQTIRRCVFFAQREGYNALEVVNLYAWRATDPSELFKAGGYPVGPENDQRIREAVDRADIVIAAWGGHKLATNRAREVVAAHPNVLWHCLGHTVSGAPRHPSRLSNDTKIVLYEGATK